MGNKTINGVEHYDICLIEPDVRFLIMALETHQTLFKEGFFSWERCEDLKHRLNYAIGVKEGHKIDLYKDLSTEKKEEQ